MGMSHDGKVIIVTGAGRGIGRAIATRLGADGAAVAVNSLHPDTAQRTADDIEANGGRALAVPADVSDRAAVDEMVDTVVRELGRLDAMVANAGVITIRTFMDITPEDLDELHRVNVHGFVYCAQAAARAMIAAETRGKILAATSVSGREGYEFMGHYSATKFAIRGLMQTAAKELARYGITVNAFCPGYVETDMAITIGQGVSSYLGLDMEVALAEFSKRIPLGRFERPEDVAGLVSFMLSDDANYMTGQTVAIEGGVSAS
jgi:meso-butanediol dehydrogenase/(S,S)-butanediol dehydrogenase/diacetyl reductase